jgi:lysophospholipase L1-like esterase
VVAIGDSYVGAPVFLLPKVEALAIAEGALASGESYRDYSIPGTTMDTPEGAGTIPPQWTAAKEADPDIHAVIMAGGGNDILASLMCIAEGSDTNPTCTAIIDRVAAVVETMYADMEATGVSDIVYFFYPNVPGGGHDILDYSIRKSRAELAAHTSATFRVHLIDTRPAFDGHPEYFGTDPIHANQTGAQRLAELVWATMQGSRPAAAAARRSGRSFFINGIRYDGPVVVQPSRLSSIQSPRANAQSSPSEVNTAAPPSHLRPSRPRGQPMTTCGSPTFTFETSLAVNRPRTAS